MTVKKLSPKKQPVKTTPEQLDLIDRFIGGGGKTTEESRASNIDPDSLIRFSIRIPPGLVKMIDDQREQKVGNVSRNTWILEAIAQRLKEGD